MAEATKPAHVSEQQWKRFQELQTRRKRAGKRSSKRRVEAVQNQAIKAVSKELSALDKGILLEEEEGVELSPSSCAERARSHGRSSSQRQQPSTSHEERERIEPHSEASPGCSHSSAAAGSDGDAKWEELRKFLDPNPHLTTQELGCHAPKSGLEEAMERAIERGQLEDAAELSDIVANREFASRIATAFDCQEYTAKLKAEEERKRERRKLKKPKTGFAVKQRWEMKGNM